MFHRRCSGPLRLVWARVLGWFWGLPEGVFEVKTREFEIARGVLLRCRRDESAIGHGGARRGHWGVNGGVNRVGRAGGVRRDGEIAEGVLDETACEWRAGRLGNATGAGVCG